MAQPNKMTSWPDAAPLIGEELIVTISCGNSHLNWATHLGEEEEFNPHIFWRTPHLKEDDLQNEDNISILSKNLPDEPHDYVFGKSAEATTNNAASQSKLRTVPLLSVYVVSTNQEQEALLAKMWETVPSRFFVMKGDDFFNKDEGRYDTMGTDRLATLTGAVHLHGHPSLVFDGGTATTYSATDGSGRIMGGGIGPGIQSKFRSLRTDTSALPEISSEEVISRVKEAQESGKPLPTFARNTQEAMMVDAFQEFALKGRNVIEHWLEKAFKKSMSTTSATSSGGTKVNSGKRVLCTGGDGDLLMQLLQPHHGGLIEQVESDRALSNGVSVDLRYEVDSSKHLIHYGIACVLLKQSKLSKQQHKELKIHETLQDNVETRKLDVLNEYVGKREAKSKRSKLSKQQHKELKIHETLQDNVETRKLDVLNEYVGKRVAKRFNVETDDGDKIFRGIVMKVIEIPGAESEFLIKYDDGDGEDVTLDELLSMLRTYVKHGEKKSIKVASAKRDRSKKNDAAEPQKEPSKPTLSSTSSQASGNASKGEKKKLDRPKKIAAVAQIQPKDDGVVETGGSKSLQALDSKGMALNADQSRKETNAVVDGNKKQSTVMRSSTDDTISGVTEDNLAATNHIATTNTATLPAAATQSRKNEGEKKKLVRPKKNVAAEPQKEPSKPTLSSTSSRASGNASKGEKKILDRPKKIAAVAQIQPKDDDVIETGGSKSVQALDSKGINADQSQNESNALEGKMKVLTTALISADDGDGVKSNGMKKKLGRPKEDGTTDQHPPANHVGEKAIDISSFPTKTSIPSFHMSNGASSTAKKRGRPREGVVAAGGKPPAAKKVKIVDEFTTLVNSSDPLSFVRQRISKDFDGGSFFGTILKYDNSENPAFWHVEYDDGDEEDFNKRDLMKALRHYSIHGNNDPNKTTKSTVASHA